MCDGARGIVAVVRQLADIRDAAERCLGEGVRASGLGLEIHRARRETERRGRVLNSECVLALWRQRLHRVDLDERIALLRQLGDRDGLVHANRRRDGGALRRPQIDEVRRRAQRPEECEPERRVERPPHGVLVNDCAARRLHPARDDGIARAGLGGRSSAGGSRVERERDQRHTEQCEGRSSSTHVPS